jgi:CDGSH-type Zn-finger protein
VVQEKSTVAICNCGLTDTPPFCDGSHAEIE